MYGFDFHKAASVDDAVSILATGETTILAGGQTLIPTLKQRLAMPEKVLSISGIEDLKGLRRVGRSLSIGAMTTHAEVVGNIDFPALAALAKGIGDPAVRNRGTLGGSLANNDPGACYPAAALACGAEITTNARTIGAHHFFQGLFETALQENELITQVAFPVPDHAAYVKFAQPASKFAMTGVFVAVFDGRYQVAVTGAAEDGVFLWEQAQTALTDDKGADVMAIDLPDIDFINDIHGSGAYRAHLTKVMAKRAIAQLRSSA